MPMSFPTIEHVARAAEMHGFRKQNTGEADDAYRTAVADHVATRDAVESMEIRTGMGWDKWDDNQKREYLIRAMAR